MGKKNKSGAKASETRAQAAGGTAEAAPLQETTVSPTPPSVATPPLSPEPEIEALVARLRAGRCVLCAGTRLGSGALGFRALVEKMLTHVEGVDRADAARALSQRPLAAAGFARRRLGERFVTELRLATQPQAELSEVVQLLAALPFRAVVTTAYDDTFERAFADGGAQPRVYTPADALELKKDGKARFVFKALGDPHRDGTVVFSAEDLQGVLADGGYRAVAQELYRSRSFLFVGFEAQDPDLGILLERILSGASSAGAEHFAMLPGLSAIEREELWAAYRIRVLDTSDVSALARALKDAIGDQVGPALPDEDDLDAWIALLTDEPGRVDALDRLDAIERQARTAGDHERLVELFLSRVAVEADAARRAGMLLEVARLFENEVGDLAKAFTALLAAYKEDPQTGAWTELERLATATGLWSELLSELTALVPQLPDGDRARSWVRIAQLYGEKLGHTEDALHAAGEALKLDPALSEAQLLRIDLYRRTERWKELAEALAVRAGSEDSPGLRAELFVEQADIYESRIGDGERAVAAYRRALEADPSSEEARASLETLHRRRGEWKELVALLDEKVPKASPEDAALYRREAAELCAEKLGDRRGAAERYEALLRDLPGDLETLRALERIYTQDSRHDEYLSVLGQQADAVESDRERAALYRRLAAEWEEQPGGGARAAEWLERLLALDARSEDAFRSLERIHRAERRWPELVDAFRRHAAIVPTPMRGEIFAQVGALYEQELHDQGRAIEAYLDVESALPGHTEALSALTRLYERTEDWGKAVEILERRALTAEVKSEKVALLARAGEITAERLGDAKAAEARFVRALENDATHVPAMTALVEIYRKNGDFLKAAKLLVEAVPHTQNRLEKTRLYVEAGEIYDGLEDHKKAIDLYLEALAVDPEHVEAAERVSDLLWDAERYPELLPILEMLTRKEADPNTQVERLVRLGRSAKSVGAVDKVLKAYARAAELDPANLEAQRGRAELHFAKSEWKEAKSALEKVEQHHDRELPPSERVELYLQIAQCELKLDGKEAAKAWLERALALDPAHRPSLLLRMEFGEAKPESLIDAKKALLQTAPVDEQVKLLAEIGDLYLDKLEDPPLAVGAYREALELKPDDHKLLHKCLDVYVEQKHWAQGLSMLERLIAIEKVAAVRAKYRHAAGLICRDELGRPDEAAKLLYEALEDDATLDRSAEALEELFKERQDWKELTRFFRRMLKRLGPETPGRNDGHNAERLRMWSELGAICLDRLGEPESALAALEVALSFDRANLDRHKQLADLYVQAGPDHFEKAITEHQFLLQREKNRVQSYRSLKHLYLHSGQREKAGACSYALAFLKKGEPDDAKLVAELKQRPLAPVRRALNEESWARLAHPDEDRVLMALFTAVAPLLAAAQAQPHKALGLNRKEAIDSSDPRVFAKALRYVCSTLATPIPEAYVRYEQKEAITFLNAVDKQTPVPVFQIGQPLLGDKRPEREIIFELSRRAAHLRPERLLRYALPQPAQIAHVIDAAMALAGDPGDSTTGELAKTAQGLKRSLPPLLLEQVVACGRKLGERGAKGEQLALAWLQASDLTAARAGLVLAQDLETCARLLAAEAPSQTALPATQRLLDLVWASVSEDLFTVRKHLGIL